MDWSKVGDWISDNAVEGLTLVGSVLTGNVPAAIAAGASLVQSATGEADPEKALSVLKNDPASRLRLEELANQERDSLRKHNEAVLKAQLEDQQAEHQQQQETIRSGDNATDEYVRRTRPRMARQSWYATISYCVTCAGYNIIQDKSMFDFYLAGVLSSPAMAYIGFRSFDFASKAFGKKKAG